MGWVVTGIGTDVGKTVVSAILCEAFACTYWKPVQAGDLKHSDSHKVAALCTTDIKILQERHKLNTPASPHFSAAKDGVTIFQNDFKIPTVSGPLLIEGAGGLMVPLNDEGLVFADLLEQWKLPVVLVSRHYLGSINHTLLSLAYLESRGIEVGLLVWIGADLPGSQDIVLQKHPKLRHHRIPLCEEVNADFVQQEAKRVSKILFP